MKISIARLKEIIMEEVARATVNEAHGGQALKTGGVGGEEDIGDPAYGPHKGMKSKTHADRDYEEEEAPPKPDLLKFLADLFGPIDPEDSDRITALASDMHTREIEKHGPFGDLGLGESLNIEIVDDE